MAKAQIQSSFGVEPFEVAIRQGGSVASSIANTLEGVQAKQQNIRDLNHDNVVMVTVTTGDEQVVFSHGLGRTPKGYMVRESELDAVPDGGGISLYYTQDDKQSWDKDKMILRGQYAGRYYIEIL